jgi:uncharacterized membrane protein HdeD (DUF308 family)
MRTRDKFDVGLVYVWVLTVLVWLLTLMAAFAVRGNEAIAALVIAIVYSILNRFKSQHRWIRVLMGVLLVVAGLLFILLICDIESAYNAAPRP